MITKRLSEGNINAFDITLLNCGWVRVPFYHETKANKLPDWVNLQGWGEMILSYSWEQIKVFSDYSSNSME